MGKTREVYHLERIDGATPMYYWFIMAPYFSPPFGSGLRRLLSQRCIVDVSSEKFKSYEVGRSYTPVI